MRITTIVDHEDGSATFTADLSPKELQFYVEVGINACLDNGVTVIDSDKVVIHDEPDGVQ